MLNAFFEFNPSRVVHRINSCTDDELQSETGVLPFVSLLEAMAQSCGLHLRWRHAFLVNAYLVSCSSLTLPPAVGPYPAQHIHARCISVTSQAALYEVLVMPLSLRCRMLVGYAPSVFQEHFHHRFQCLTS